MCSDNTVVFFEEITNLTFEISELSLLSIVEDLNSKLYDYEDVTYYDVLKAFSDAGIQSIHKLLSWCGSVAKCYVYAVGDDSEPRIEVIDKEVNVKNCSVIIKQFKVVE